MMLTPKPLQTLSTSPNHNNQPSFKKSARPKLLSSRNKTLQNQRSPSLLDNHPKQGKFRTTGIMRPKRKDLNYQSIKASHKLTIDPDTNKQDRFDRIFNLKEVTYKSTKKSQSTRTNFLVDVVRNTKTRKQLILAEKQDNEQTSASKRPFDKQLQNQAILKLLQTRRYKRPPKNINPQAQLLNAKMKNLQHIANEQENKRNQQPAAKKISIYTRHHSNSRPKQQQIEKIQQIKNRSEINQLKNYDYLGQLGVGGYARVVLAKNKLQNHLYAIKIYDKLMLESKSKISNIKREITIMKVLNHQNISAYRESYENQTTVFIVMQFCGTTSLYAYLNSHSNSILPERKAKYIFTRVISAIAHMKQQNIVHRDIKAENILLVGDSVKLIDFGFSVFVEANEKIRTFCGTPTYMSPEIVSRIPYDPYAADIWSLGILLYLLLQGQYPFMSPKEQILFEKIRRGNFKYIYQISPEAKNLIESMLMVEAPLRATINELLNFRWFHTK